MNEWRNRHMWAQTLGRTVERQADNLRRVLCKVADGTGTREDVDATIRAIQFQLDQASKLAGELSLPPGESPTPRPPASLTYPPPTKHPPPPSDTPGKPGRSEPDYS